MAIVITGLSADDKVPGVVNQIRYGAGKRNSANGTVWLYLLGNMRGAVTASIGSVTRTGGVVGPLITTSGTPTADREFIVEITTGGAVATAVFRWSKDDGATYTTGVTTAATVLLADGVTVAFPAGTYVVGEIYSFTATAATTYGTAALDTVYDIDTIDTSAALFGAGSELDLMCDAALRIPGVSVRAIAQAEASGGAAASVSVTFGGSWTTGGTVMFRLNGKPYPVNVSSSHTATTLGWAAQDVFNGFARSPVVADSDAGVMALRTKCKGARGNYYSLWVDMSEAPSGLTVSISGGATLTGGGKFFSSGSGADDVTTSLATLLPATSAIMNVIASAQNDAVNLALIETQVDTKSGPLIQQYEQFVTASNGTQASVVALSQTTMNHQLGMILHCEQDEVHPSIIAAEFGAMRAFYEGLARGSNTVDQGIPNGGPNCNYDGAVLPQIPPRATVAMAAEPSRSKLKTLLNSGVTPVITVGDKRKIVRAITSKCLDGITPDYRTLDVGEATVPIVMSRRIAAAGADFMATNPYAGPDPDQQNGEKDAPEGIATPSGWNSALQSLLRAAEADKLIYNVDDNLPVVEWDADAERIMSSTPLAVRPLNHQLGNEIRQV